MLEHALQAGTTALHGCLSQGWHDVGALEDDLLACTSVLPRVLHSAKNAEGRIEGGVTGPGIDGAAMPLSLEVAMVVPDQQVLNSSDRNCDVWGD